MHEVERKSDIHDGYTTCNLARSVCQLERKGELKRENNAFLKVKVFVIVELLPMHYGCKHYFYACKLDDKLKREVSFNQVIAVFEPRVRRLSAYG